MAFLLPLRYKMKTLYGVHTDRFLGKWCMSPRTGMRISIQYSYRVYRGELAPGMARTDIPQSPIFLPRSRSLPLPRLRLLRRLP